MAQVLPRGGDAHCCVQLPTNPAASAWRAIRDACRRAPARDGNEPYRRRAGALPLDRGRDGAYLLAWRTALTVSPGFTLRPGLCGVARSIARMRGPGGRRRMVDSVLWRGAGRGPQFIGPRAPPYFLTGGIAPPPP